MELALKDQSATKSFSAKINAINSEILLCESKSHLYAGLEKFWFALRLIDNDELVKKTSSDPKAVVRVSQPTVDNVFKAFSTSMLYFSIADTRAVAVRDWYSFSRFSEGVTVSVPDSYFNELASGYANGAVASMDYFRENNVSTVLNADAMTRLGAPVLSGKEASDYKEILYGYLDQSFSPLRYAVNASRAGGDRINEKPDESSYVNREKILDVPSLEYDDQPMAIFGYAAYSYVGLAHLLFKRETFQGSYDQVNSDNNIVLQNRKALTRFLDIARDRALRKQALVKMTFNEVPDSIVINLNLADTKRYGAADEDRLQAFISYWRVSLLCDLAMDIKLHVQNEK